MFGWFYFGTCCLSLKKLCLPFFFAPCPTDASVKQTIVEEYGSTCPQGYKRFNSTHCQGNRQDSSWNKDAVVDTGSFLLETTGPEYNTIHVHQKTLFICTPLKISTSARCRASVRTETVSTHWAASNVPARPVSCWKEIDVLVSKRPQWVFAFLCFSLSLE